MIYLISLLIGLVVALILFILFQFSIKKPPTNQTNVAGGMSFSHMKTLNVSHVAIGQFSSDVDKKESIKATKKAIIIPIIIGIISAVLSGFLLDYLNVGCN